VHHLLQHGFFRFEGERVDFSPAGRGRMLVALAVLSALAACCWATMERGQYRSLCLILLGFFAFRVLLARMRAR
jgi:hypothetical protein